MKRIFFLIVLTSILLAACGASAETIALQTSTAATANAASWTKTPTLTPTHTLTPTSTLMPTITPTPLPITFFYQDDVPADGRTLQEQSANKAYMYFSQYVDLGEIKIYTFSDIDLIMDEVHPSILADGNVSRSQLREGWATTGGTSAEDKVIINPNHINWQDGSVCFKAKNVAHEIFHITQARLLRHRLRPDVINYGPEWLKEGSAEVMGHHLADGLNGCTYKARHDWWIKASGDANFSLQQVEGGDFNNKNRFWEVAPLAVDYLINFAPNGEKSVIQYYSEIGDGKSWRDAFKASFGMLVQDFYIDFQAYQDTLKTIMDTSVCVPQSDVQVKCLGLFNNNGVSDYAFEIPLDVLIPTDKWKFETSPTCVITGWGLERNSNTDPYKLLLSVSNTTHGNCQVHIQFTENLQVTVDFVVP